MVSVTLESRCYSCLFSQKRPYHKLPTRITQTAGNFHHRPLTPIATCTPDKDRFGYLQFFCRHGTRHCHKNTIVPRHLSARHHLALAACGTAEITPSQVIHNMFKIFSTTPYIPQNKSSLSTRSRPRPQFPYVQKIPEKLLLQKPSRRSAKLVPSYSLAIFLNTSTCSTL